VTAGEAIAAARERLQSESAPADARVILCHVLRCEPAWLLAHADAPLEAADEERFFHLIARRALGVPVPYLTKETWFYGARYELTRDVLVPRPETETLVEGALAFLRGHEQPNPDVPLRVCDIGTGSGIIAISLARALPGITVDAIDCSGAALDVARRNAVTHDVDGRVRCMFGDVLDGMPYALYDCIVANLPYVPTADIPTKPDPVGHEPLVALDGGRDGLALYRRLLRSARHYMHERGALFMEAAPPTIVALAALAREAIPGARVEIVPDASGLPRVVAARRGPDEREAATT
jgi:release factor glutamine methyltransferase